MKHEHHHPHHDDCCEHQHSHHDDTCHHTTEHFVVPDGERTKVYRLEHLGCANCAAKMEKQISEIDGISSATITFATKQLRIVAKCPELYHERIQAICSSIEAEVSVQEIEETKKACEKQPEHKTDLALILLGAALFLIAKVLESFSGVSPHISIVLFLVSYLILGAKIIFTALRNIVRGQIFDENFLMSLATLGAIAVGQFDEAVGVMLFYRIGEFFEETAVEKSRKQIMDAVDLRPETVNLVTNNEIIVMEAKDAQPGNILLVRPGDRIPLDGFVVEGKSRIDTSPITGEPIPVKVAVQSKVISGCINTSGQLKIQVEKPLSESMVTKILNSVENAAAGKPRLDRFITRFARIYTPIVVSLALATAVLPSLFTGNWSYWIYTALTFLVMSCPCALVLSVPLAFFSGIGAGSKKGILFKGGLAIEALSNIRAVAMDKTGTLTQGNFVLQKVLPMGSHTTEELLTLAGSCEQYSTHPIAVSIVNAVSQESHLLETPLSLEEIPGHGIRARLSVGEVLCGNQKLMEKFGVSLSDTPKETYGSEVLVAVNNVYVGCLIVSDTLKSDAKDAIHHLRKQHIHTALLTGDAHENALAIAKETGIDEIHAKLLPEDKLKHLSDIRSEYGAVLFVGDGINDAPVLAGADVGAAMGSGADAAIEAADVVFLNSSVDAIPSALSIARTTRRISMQNVVFALAIKIIAMLLGLFGFASMWVAVFADTGVAMLCILNSIRILYRK